jgi:hypothetical protein
VGPRAGLDVVENRSLTPAENRTPAVQPIARNHIDCAILTPGGGVVVARLLLPRRRVGREFGSFRNTSQREELKMY